MSMTLYKSEMTSKDNTLHNREDNIFQGQQAALRRRGGGGVHDFDDNGDSSSTDDFLSEPEEEMNFR
jgi:hypothetical protein